MGKVTGIPGVEDCREIFRGRSRQADVSGVPTYVRVYLVQTNVLNADLQNIAKAPKISWKDPHPDDANAYLVESSTQQEGDSPFCYKLTYTYKYLDESEAIPWNRPATFSFSGSLASAPAFWYYPNEDDNATKKIIVNSAGDPLQGLDRDEGEFSVTIQKNIPPPFGYAKAQQYVGAINSDVWSGGDAKTWKCQSITATRKVETVADTVNPNDKPKKVFYWDCTATLAYKATGWDLVTWDVGFNELVNSKRVKIYAGSEPVSEPVALKDGRAKTPGQPPESLSFRIYPMKPFTGVFPALPNSAPTGYSYPSWQNLFS